MATYLLKAPDVEMAVWKSAAQIEGVPFAEWLRRAATAACARNSGLVKMTPSSIKHRPQKKAKARSEMCVHRRRPDEFCSRCDG